MDLSIIKAAVEAAITDCPNGCVEDISLLAASALPTEASDFDRGMAVGFAVASLLESELKDEIGISRSDR